MAATMMVVIAIILGSLVIASRTGMGLLGSAYQNESREARAAAEIGMAQVVSELNRPRNRQLLVNACRLLDSTPTQIATLLTLKVPDGRATPDITATFDQGLSTIPSSQTIPIDGGAVQRWQLLSANCIGAANLSMGRVDNSFTAANEAQAPLTGDLTLSVRGYALREGAVVATSTIEQTFEVVPKCLDRSLRGLSNAFGNDDRFCSLNPGSGFIVGTARLNSGSISITGSAYSISTDTSPPQSVDPIACIATTSGSCTNGLSGTSLNEVTITLPPVPSTANTICQGVTSGNCNVTVSTNTILATRQFATWPTPWSAICTRQAANGAASPPGSFDTIACSLNRLTTANNITLVFDTSGSTAGSTIPIRLHFPNASNPGTPSIKRGSGTSGIYQCHSNAGSLSCEPNPPPPATATMGAVKPGDLALFGCPLTPTSCGSQHLELGSGNGTIQSLYVYFPTGVVTMNGTPNFSGAMWVNSFSGNGNISITIPDLTSICNLLKFCGSDDANYDTFNVDYVTRAVKSLSFF
jgi:hypothetical protein